MFQLKVVEKIKTHISCSILFSRKWCLYEIIWKNIVEPTDYSIIRGMRFVSWITKARDTHPEYVILIAFQTQKWLRERTSMLRYSTVPLFFVLVIMLSPNKSACSEQISRLIDAFY